MQFVARRRGGRVLHNNSIPFESIFVEYSRDLLAPRVDTFPDARGESRSSDVGSEETKLFEPFGPFYATLLSNGWIVERVGVVSVRGHAWWSLNGSADPPCHHECNASRRVVNFSLNPWAGGAQRPREPQNPCLLSVPVFPSVAQPSPIDVAPHRYRCMDAQPLYSLLCNLKGADLRGEKVSHANSCSLGLFSAPLFQPVHFLSRTWRRDFQPPSGLL